MPVYFLSIKYLLLCEAFPESSQRVPCTHFEPNTYHTVLSTFLLPARLQAPWGQ